MSAANTRDLEAKLNALDSSQAIIEFNMDGTIITANANFLGALGYSLDEIRGQHHRMFVLEDEKNAPSYRQFWDALNRGEFQAGEYLRVGKGGKEIWIQATYNPLKDSNGKPYKVVKFATDITATKQKNADYEGQINAIGKSQAVISFGLDGTILDANKNFLDAVGYSLEEIQGKDHSIFVDAQEKASAESRRFWEALARGEYQSAEYRRIGKGGKEIWIQASYNPIFDFRGRPFKVVKYATDITSAVQERKRKAEIQAAIDVDLGLITEAITRTNDQASSAAASSTQTYENVQAVASAAEELVASFGEIGRRVHEASDVARKAFDQSEMANQLVKGLSDAGMRIGQVVELINSIASQTNLLALNATIEAARAGEAGKGFSVVAQEVKTLASQTAKATADIGAQISAVQSGTTSVVEALKDIAGVIGAINDISNGIAAAVEEQTAVTQDISSNMQTAATGVQVIGDRMSEIAQETNFASESARKVKENSKTLVA